jgi:hypothetical protein
MQTEMDSVRASTFFNDIFPPYVKKYIFRQWPVNPVNLSGLSGAEG